MVETSGKRVGETLDGTVRSHVERVPGSGRARYTGNNRRTVNCHQLRGNARRHEIRLSDRVGGARVTFERRHSRHPVSWSPRDVASFPTRSRVCLTLSLSLRFRQIELDAGVKDGGPDGRGPPRHAQIDGVFQRRRVPNRFRGWTTRIGRLERTATVTAAKPVF